MTGNGAKNEQKPAAFRLVSSSLGVSIVSITKFRFRVLIDFQVSISKNRLLKFFFDFEYWTRVPDYSSRVPDVTAYFDDVAA